MEDNLFVYKVETADIKPCPHGRIFLDLCCECLKDMLYRALSIAQNNRAKNIMPLMDDDIELWWNNHKEN